jgi:O-antigen ligase
VETLVLTAALPALAVALYGYALRVPQLLLALGCALIVITAQGILPGGDTGQKAALLGILGVFAVRYGIRQPRLLWMLAVVAVISFGFSLWPDGRDPLTVLRGGLGLGLAWLAFYIRWPERTLRQFLGALPWLPLISLGVALPLWAAVGHAPILSEYTGAVRVQGASSPAHFAMLGVVGVIASAYLARVRGGKLYDALIGFNLLMVLASGTRGALIAAVIVLLPTLWQYVRDGFGRRPVMSTLALLLIGAAGVVAAPNLIERSFGNSLEAGVNTSGRTDAWEFFAEQWRTSPAFGVGLGMVSQLTEGQEGNLTKFLVPHNEYLRMAVDTGLVGAALYILALLRLFRRVGQRVPERAFFAAVILGFLVYSGVDNTFGTVQFAVPFALLLACLYGLSTADSPRRSRP